MPRRYTHSTPWTIRYAHESRDRIIRIRPSRPDAALYHYNHTATTTRTERRATFTVEIDLDALCAELAHRASGTKAGKASVLDGIIRARLTSQPEILSTKTTEHPIPDGYEPAS